MADIAAVVGNSTASVNGHLTGGMAAAARSFYRPMLGPVLRRVEKRLKAVGLSAAAASREAGLSEDAIRNMKRAAEDETGRQGVSTATILALAPVLKTTAGWLLEGKGDESLEPKSVALVGYVGAGAEAHYYADAQGPFDEVEAPPGVTDETVAVEIRGSSLGSFFDEWLVFYDDVRSPVTSDLIGRLCVVALPDDRVLVKKLQRAADGRFHLLSQTEDPILDQEVVWAARVKHMRPR